VSPSIPKLEIMAHHSAPSPQKGMKPSRGAIPSFILILQGTLHRKDASELCQFEIRELGFYIPSPSTILGVGRLGHKPAETLQALHTRTCVGQVAPKSRLRRELQT
jgi:hypothetical protein